MSEKMDRQGVRTAADVERKYQFGKQFSEIMGLVSDARDAAFKVESDLRSEILEQATSITRNTEQIVMSAMEGVVSKTELEEYQKTVSSELAVMAEKISLSFTSATEYIDSVDEELQGVNETLSKYFDFSVNGLLIKSGEKGAMSLLLDSGLITFLKDGQPFGFWDGVNFYTGNIFIGVDEVAQFGNYGFVPYEDAATDGLDLVRVGG